MKAIINGVRYDTDKATEIGGTTGGSQYSSDFSHWSATLYVTPRAKRHFLAGSGGPMSRYARSTSQNSTSGGSQIDPMSEAEAFEWAQEYLDAEAVEEHFGHLIEDADEPANAKGDTA